ncbi:hypothetical protein EG329_013103 [Mollisiaceae sp. DMI_Dod_QoI]|nr:hypothetical protein EG329_013103 [Helotiales sp. DMI_Dod_QoI]
MAKTTSKRKSESALPTGKSKQRRTSASRIDEENSSQDAGGSSDQLFVQEKPAAPKYVKKTVVKSRKSEPARLTKEDDEYEDDEGRMETQQFLALVEHESKKKKRAAKAASEYMDRFKEGIQSSDDALKMRLVNLIAASTKQSTTFLSAFRNAYASSRPLPPPSTETSLPDEICFVTLFDHSQSLINNAFEIISRFETANEKTENLEIAELLDNEWELENGTAARVLAVGHNVGLEKYQALLQGAGEPVMDEDTEIFAELIYGADVRDTSAFEYGWGKVAKKGEKAARKFVKFQRVNVA